MSGEFDIRINKTSKPITFCILDGWGISKNNFKNAVKNAYTPNFDYLNKNYYKYRGPLEVPVNVGPQG